MSYFLFKTLVGGVFLIAGIGVGQLSIYVQLT